MYKFEINEVSVNTAVGKKQIIPKSINVIVGPNNSGKSRLLKELRDYLSGDREELKILNEVQYTFPQSFEELDESYNVTDKMVKNQYGSWILKTYENKPRRRKFYWKRASNIFGDYVNYKNDAPYELWFYINPYVNGDYIDTQFGFDRYERIQKGCGFVKVLGTYNNCKCVIGDVYTEEQFYNYITSQ